MNFTFENTWGCNLWLFKKKKRRSHTVMYFQKKIILYLDYTSFLSELSVVKIEEPHVHFSRFIHALFITYWIFHTAVCKDIRQKYWKCKYIYTCSYIKFVFVILYNVWYDALVTVLNDISCHCLLKSSSPVFLTGSKNFTQSTRDEK